MHETQAFHYNNNVSNPLTDHECMRDITSIDDLAEEK